MSAYTQTSRPTIMEKFVSKPTCWQDGVTEQVVRFWVEDQLLGFPYWTLCATCYVPETETLTLDFPLGTFIITGPKALAFYNSFCNNRATLLKQDGIDILTVNFDLRATEQAKE